MFLRLLCVHCVVALYRRGKIIYKSCVTRHRWWCSRVQVPAVWERMPRHHSSVHAAAFSLSGQCYRESAGRLKATERLCHSSFHCLFVLFTALYTEKRLLHKKILNIEIGKQKKNISLCLQSRQRKFKKQKKKRIDSITQYTQVGFTRRYFLSPSGRCFFLFLVSHSNIAKATQKSSWKTCVAK